MRSPCYRAGAFYGGYICGREPYLPISAVECSEAFVRAGFTITHTAVILAMDTRDCSANLLLPRLYHGRDECGARVRRSYVRVCRDERGRAGGPLLCPLLTRVLPRRRRVDRQVGGVWTDDSHRNRGLASVLTTDGTEWPARRRSDACPDRNGAGQRQRPPCVRETRVPARAWHPGVVQNACP